LNPYAHQVAAYRISQVVERTGFSAPTLRYYEDIGLVRPAQRTDAGYRVYDDRAVDRLRFVARAKRLGLTLDEIADLVSLWDAEECAPVQARLRALLVAKQADLTGQIAELAAFHDELGRVASRLGIDAPDGACGPSCGCIDDSPEVAGDAVPVRLERRSASIAAAPVACTLDPAAMPGRLAAWQRLAEQVRERVDTPSGTRVRFAADASAGAIAELVAAEQQCCAFFSFRLSWAEGQVVLEIDAPAEARALIDTLLPRD